MNGVAAYDWASFLHARVDAVNPPLLDGLAASGWKLVYTDTPSAYYTATMKGRGASFIYSLGMALDGGGKVGEVRWDSPAFDAGLGSGMQVLAVNDLHYSADELEEAVRAAKAGKQPIRLLVKDVDVYRTLAIDYHDGLRYPVLQRIEGTTDYLTPIFSARK